MISDHDHDHVILDCPFPHLEDLNCIFNICFCSKLDQTNLVVEETFKGNISKGGGVDQGTDAITDLMVAMINIGGNDDGNGDDDHVDDDDGDNDGDDDNDDGDKDTHNNSIHHTVIP